MSARNSRQSLVAAIAGAFSEAWAEVRIHRTRVLLSLIGVAVAVTAITSVVGLGSVAEQSLRESNERNSGRPASLQAYVNSQDGSPIDSGAVAAAFQTTMDRYGIEYHSRRTDGSLRIQFTNGAADVSATAIDVPFGTMHRVSIDHGSWFADSDGTRLAPAIVANGTFWRQLGSPDLRTHPTASVLGQHPTTAVIIGVTRSAPRDPPTMYILADAYEAVADPAVQQGPMPSFEAWVPPAISTELIPLLKRDLVGVVPAGTTVEVNRNDYAAYGGDDPLLPFKIIVGGVAGLVLFLGALGLVNISLVTVRQRIREIGIRRSFGATAGRVFFAVMMESVVATVAAGVVGVAAAIAIVENPWLQSKISQGVVDLPPFPIEAAIIGLIAATAVGALAGLLPAIVAVRVKVIDAIRY
ncbi:ABC transporter permease [Lacisediminihabitans sp.]|uniref:ABC transporter permease n=1 Tax=Lacisediminihabitans sp. TaxID=2787631 RepID=UPI002F92BBE5